MLTSKQRAYLRGLSNGLDAIFHVGKGGVTPEFTDSVDKALEARELVKINVEAVVVAAAQVEPAAGGIDQASRKAAFQDGGQAGSLELPPALIEKDIGGYTGKM